MSKRYCIRIHYPEGDAFLSHRDKSAWCRRTALKYLQEWQQRFPDRPATIELDD